MVGNRREGNIEDEKKEKRGKITVVLNEPVAGSFDGGAPTHGNDLYGTYQDKIFFGAMPKIN